MIASIWPATDLYNSSGPWKSVGVSEVVTLLDVWVILVPGKFFLISSSVQVTNELVEVACKGRGAWLPVLRYAIASVAITSCERYSDARAS